MTREAKQGIAKNKHDLFRNFSTNTNGVKAGKKPFFYMTGIWSLNLTSRTREADGFDFILVMYCPSTNLILFH